MAHTFGVLKDALNGQGRLTRPAVHRCVRQLRETVRNKDRRGEAESLVGGKGVAGASEHNSAAAKDVLDRLFDAFDVHNTGDVDFYEFASALSVSRRDAKTFIWMPHVVVSYCTYVRIKFFLYYHRPPAVD